MNLIIKGYNYLKTFYPINNDSNQFRHSTTEFVRKFIFSLNLLSEEKLQLYFKDQLKAADVDYSFLTYLNHYHVIFHSHFKLLSDEEAFAFLKKFTHDHTCYLLPSVACSDSQKNYYFTHIKADDMAGTEQLRSFLTKSSHFDLIPDAEKEKIIEKFRLPVDYFEKQKKHIINDTQS